MNTFLIHHGQHHCNSLRNFLSDRHPEYQISGAYSEPGADFAGKYSVDDNGYLLNAEFEVREIMKSEFGYSDDDLEDWFN